MTERAQPTDLELAALISSKICHDVIGPVGAIYNGLEILDEDDDARGQDLRARRHSQRHRAGLRAPAVRPLRLRRRRLGGRPDRPRHRRADQPRPDRPQGKHKLVWRGIPGQMAKDKVKLLLNLVASAVTALPRGGEIEVAIAGSLEQAELRAALPRHGGAPAAVSRPTTSAAASRRSSMPCRSRPTTRGGWPRPRRMRLDIAKDGADVLLSAKPMA